MFSQSSILLLDDVLSAVDTHTSNHIIINCLRGPLSSNRTILLVSNAVEQCFSIADFVVVLETGGRVCMTGSVDSIISRLGSASQEDEKLRQILRQVGLGSEVGQAIKKESK